MIHNLLIHNVLKGCIIGFSTAMPIGSIGVLCIRRTLTGGFLCGAISGLGSATVDAVLVSQYFFLLSSRVCRGNRVEAEPNRRFGMETESI